MALAAAVSLAGCGGLPTGDGLGEGPRVLAWSRLPAASFVAGPPSGRRLGLGLLNGQAVPFSRQPVQGLSAALRDGDALLVLADNGFGNRRNSVDALLHLFRLQPEFRRSSGEPAGVRIAAAWTLSDPQRRISFALQRPQDRRLTGADFDPEGLARAADGSLWLGEEFGPFLLHVDAQGRVLEPPIALPDPEHPERGLMSPDHPALRGKPPGAAARVRRSGGIEGLTAFPGGRLLLVALEKPLRDAPGVLPFWEFDTAARRFTGRRWRYPLEPGVEGVGEILLLSETEGLALERGPVGAPGPRRLMGFRLEPEGAVATWPLADFRALPDPARLAPGHAGNPPGLAHIPFINLESLALWAPGQILVGNDNNYPYGSLRQRAKGRPDDSEFLLLSLP
ncbi:MAG: esterase-like activity of phytase family protein [Gammaproteobacteria bacterium]|nr:esterase-like activity of phytase family protein [Gammaproteobacteria bacterium]